MTQPLRSALSRAAAILSLCLAAVAPAQAQEQGFLTQRPDVRIWLPPAPPAGSLAQAEDETIYLHTRALLDGPRGAEAAADNVYLPDAVAPRFADALGATLNPKDTPLTLALIGRVVKDAEALVAPVKQSPPPKGTGRVRPFVAFGGRTCPLRPDDYKFHLPETGSYPSTHAALGWIWASVLTALAPDRADRLIARGIAFGDSRVICGFHYKSDVDAGRLAAAALMAREAADPGFQAALAAAKREFDAYRRRP
ncbi:MAG: phosphatase PAP2 family protein [Alphaproteobacteria bacterium]|nr:phosphatase PAP2 family protein [Alphaproteobacteria bacterium]